MRVQGRRNPLFDAFAVSKREHLTNKTANYTPVNVKLRESPSRDRGLPAIN
jgi:hypothetical protein